MSRLSPRFVIIAVIVCAALLLVSRRLARVVPLAPDLAVQTEGLFTPNGQYQQQQPSNAVHVRVWGSWSGSDTNTGAITLGPFIAPRVLTFAVTGYPSQQGNTLELRLAGTDKVQKLAEGDVGERWRYTDIAVPADWVGKPVTITATDTATALGGWQGISEPVRGGATQGVNAMLVSLAAWSINGLLLGVLFWATARVLERRRTVPHIWVPLVAAGIVAALGYAAFWAFFANSTVGTVFSVALLTAALVAALRKGPSHTVRSDVSAVVRLLLAIGFFYIALLHLVPSSRDFYSLASERFREGLPGDNTLPHNVAVSLISGQTIRWPGVDWLASDRPPLQSGWQLLTLPVLRALGFDDITATGTSAVWLQLLWIPAAYGLLRRLGLSRDRATAWTLLLSLSGFVLQNTVFTWPKLSAAAFGIGAFSLWVLAERRPRTDESRIARPVHTTDTPDRLYATGALLAGLAWLSHGGIAFSFIPLVPWVLWRVLRGELRGWLVASVVFAAFALPWFCFQKFYDPPGDRLVKMHLAGQDAKDPRGPLTVIREAYHNRPMADIVSAKINNFKMQAMGRWSGIVDFRPSTGWERRNDEFFSSGRALTWWSLGALVLPFALFFRPVRARFAPCARAHVALLAWTLLTVVVWCLMMFNGYTAVIHQGSYAMMLVAFVLLSAWLEGIGRWWIAVIALLQLATFVTTWAWPGSQMPGAGAGWPIVALASLLMAALFAGALRRSLNES
jgi:hypothetical protein